MKIEIKKSEKPKSNTSQVQLKQLVSKSSKEVVAQKSTVQKPAKKDSKFSMSYSRLRSYIDCPKKFEFHTKYGWEPSDQTKKTMRGGLIFEAVVLGDKDGVLDFLKSSDLKIVEQGNNFIEKKLLGEGEAYVKVSYENDIFKTRGEVDFLGEYNFSNGKRKAIIDLKYTGKIDHIWKRFKYKEDTLQIILYSWMHWKQTGEMLDGVYLVVESSYEDPVLSPREVFISEKDYIWLENFLYTVALEPVKVTNPSNKNCLGGKGIPRCPWLEYCKSGRKILGGVETYDVSMLPSKTENNINY